jgi:hypothetical protein
VIFPKELPIPNGTCGKKLYLVTIEIKGDKRESLIDLTENGHDFLDTNANIAVYIRYQRD